MTTRTGTGVTCYHCGDPCGEDHLVHAEKDFCCQGCQVVYDLLQESGLCEYYRLEDRPGTKRKTAVEEARPELFDLPEVRERLVELSEDGITRVRLHIPQMHCSSCIWLLENLHRLDPAIIRSRVRFTGKELTVTFREAGLGLRGLVELLRRIGYGPLLTGRGREEGTGPGIPRILYIKLGVAGFCFGNIMLFSFPEYLGADEGDGLLLKGFQFLNFVFSLPVLLVSSTDFFRSAWAGLRARRINIDQPIALGIIALFLRSTLDVVTGAGPGYFDSLAGLIFFLLIGRWYQAYTYSALSFDRDLNDFLPLVVLRRKGDGEEPVGVAALRPGDRIIVRDQELVPVDAVLRNGQGNIDNSFITGEPLPVKRAVGDTVRAGGRQRGAAIELEVLRPFQDSHLKRLWEEHAGDQERPLMPRMIDAVARRFTVAVLVIATGAGIYWWGHDPAQVWPVVTAVLIVACPCALALAMPFAYGHTIRLLGRRGLFLRDAEVVERMAFIDAVVFDKTGTLTQREAYAIRFSGTALTPVERSYVRSIARNSTHPLSAVLYNTIKEPFVASAFVEEEAGAGVSGVVHGVTVRVGSARFCGAPAAALEPGVRMDIAGAVHYPLDCHLSPDRFMGGLKRELDRLGARFLWSSEALDWKSSGQRIERVITTNGEVAGDEFLLCGGSWSPATAAKLDLRLPIQAGKGYSLTLPSPRRLPTLCSIFTEARVAVTPMGSSLRFGGTMELSGLDEGIDPVRVRGIIKAVSRYYPEFGPADFEGIQPWRGLRPCSPDGLPYIGRTGCRSNLTLATGHAMMGLSLAPVTGKIVAGILTGQPAGFESRMLSPDRHS